LEQRNKTLPNFGKKTERKKKKRKEKKRKERNYVRSLMTFYQADVDNASGYDWLMLPTEENMTMAEIYGNWIFDAQLQEVTSSSRDEPTSPVMIISFELIHLYIQYHTFST
jgi:hypothetical protein